MSKSLAFLPEVSDDIEQARDWYAERNPEVADRFLTALGQVLDTIERHPQQGGYHDEQRLYRCRQPAKFPYVVVYREYADQTLIVAIYHTSRHPDFWIERLD